jgi:photosystem II stability/assembly factor-like uncharacterized protein
MPGAHHWKEARHVFVRGKRWEIRAFFTLIRGHVWVIGDLGSLFGGTDGGRDGYRTTGERNVETMDK